MVNSETGSNQRLQAPCVLPSEFSENRHHSRSLRAKRPKRLDTWRSHVPKAPANSVERDMPYLLLVTGVLLVAPVVPLSVSLTFFARHDTEVGLDDAMFEIVHMTEIVTVLA